MTEERRGEALVISGGVLWSFFPIVTALSLFTLSPLVSLGWSTLLGTILFGALVTLKGKWYELRNLTALRYVLWVALLNGVLYYALYFFGLKYTSPGNAGLIALTEVLFTFLFFNVWRKDYISRKHVFGAMLMLLGAATVLLPNAKIFNPGDILVMAAMVFAPMGNYFQQKARKEISSETILFARSLLAFPLLFLLAHALGNAVSLVDLRASWIAVAINGLVLFGLSKIVWIEAIHRISVTKAIALSGINPLLTLLFSWILLNHVPTFVQLLSFFPLFLGMLLLTSQNRTSATP